MEQDLNCRPCDIWSERYLRSYPFLGIRWLATGSTQPSSNRSISNHHINNRNALEKLFLKDSSGWICGGDVLIQFCPNSKTFRSNSRIKPAPTHNSTYSSSILIYEQKSLYVFKIQLSLRQHEDVTMTISLGCESEDVCDEWIEEIIATQMRQQYISSIDMSNYSDTSSYLFGVEVSDLAVTNSLPLSGTMKKARQSTDMKLFGSLHDASRGLFDAESPLSSLIPSFAIFEGIITFQNAIHLRNIQINTLTLKSIHHFLDMNQSKLISLHTLSLENVQLRDNAAMLLASSIVPLVPALTHLSLKDNILTSKGILSICESLANGQKLLRYLNLSSNIMNDELMDHIAYNLSLCRNLCILDLSHNYLTNLSVKYITLYITSHASKLIDLNVSYNNLGDGAGAICAILMRNEPSIIEHLNVSFCNMRAMGLTEITLALPFAKSLKWLNIRGTHINTQAEIEFMKAIAHHKQMYRKITLPQSKQGPPTIQTIQVLIGGVNIGSDTVSLQPNELKSFKFSLPYINANTLMKTIALQRRWRNPLYQNQDISNNIDVKEFKRRGYSMVQLSANSMTPTSQAKLAGRYDSKAVSGNKSFIIAEDNTTNIPFSSSNRSYSIFPHINPSDVAYSRSFDGDYLDHSDKSLSGYYQSVSVLVDEFYNPMSPGSSPSSSPRSSPRSKRGQATKPIESAFESSQTNKNHSVNVADIFVYMKIKYPNFIENENEFLSFLSQSVGCDPRQLQLMTLYQSSSLPSFSGALQPIMYPDMR